MKQAGIIFGILTILAIGLTILGSMIPETSIYLGRQVPKKFTKEIRDLGLLEEDERIKYFYTVGIFDIKDGLYFVTDRKLVVYCQDWEEPETIVGFDEIIELQIEYDDSFLEDSFVKLETSDGLELAFPLSSEQGRDKEFFRYLKEKSEVQQGENKTDEVLETANEE